MRTLWFWNDRVHTNWKDFISIKTIDDIPKGSVIRLFEIDEDRKSEYTSKYVLVSVEWQPFIRWFREE